MLARETSDRASSVAGMPAGPGAGGPVTGSGVAARCWQVTRDDTGGSRGGLADLSWDPEAPSDDCGDTGTDTAAEARLRVLAAAGPFPAGSQVLVTGNGMGESRDGGFATHLRMPVDAILPVPAGLTCRDAMAVGTAGLTVALACDRLDMLVSPRHGAADAEWLVTGASGGVGMLAVAWLAAAGRLPVTTRGLAEVGSWAEAMLRGTTMGRAVVLPDGEQSQKV